MLLSSLLSISIFFICLQCVCGYFNLFMSAKEVLKFMGVNSELYYVKEGIVNNYAENFAVNVNHTVEELEFTWQSLIRMPLQYNILIDYNDTRGALLRPSLSIPSVGVIPFTQRTFKIFLHCSGNQSTEVRAEIHFKVKGPRGQNETNVCVKRNKVCLRPEDPATKTILLKHEKDSGTFVAAMFAFFITATFATVMGLSYFRNKKRFHGSIRTHYPETSYHGPQSVVIKLDPLGSIRPSSAASGSYATINSLNKYQLPVFTRSYNWFRVPSPYATTILHQNEHGVTYQDAAYEKAESIASSKISYYASSQVTQLCTLSTPSKSFHSKASAKKIQDKLKEISVRDNTIECDRLLQCGTYGRVYTGSLHEGVGHLRAALVKTVVDNATLTQVSFLLSEASLLCGMKHPNILCPIAAFTDLSGSPKIAYDMPKDNLKTFLQIYREGIQVSGAPLHTRQLVDFALHVTRALLHIHSNNLLHGDIATRNCWLTAGYNVCIGDNALSRDLFANEYYCLGDNDNRPIKWMSLEALERRQVSTASDVWQLGVLFWELATLGMMPYEEVDAFELIPYLKDGFRLAQPKNCPDKFFKIMSCCWSADPDYRPTLIQMLTYLHELFDDLGKYI